MKTLFKLTRENFLCQGQTYHFYTKSSRVMWTIEEIKSFFFKSKVNKLIPAKGFCSALMVTLRKLTSAVTANTKSNQKYIRHYYISVFRDIIKDIDIETVNLWQQKTRGKTGDLHTTSLIWNPLKELPSLLTKRYKLQR